FFAVDPATERFFAEGQAGHYQFDLEGYVLSRLAEAGLGRVEALGQDTYSQEDAFYSYRRSTHRGEPTYGRQVAIISL
ncbi:MAG TPA: laccase domain-containing protein, partial [Allosphingosinicella sp.]